MTDFETFEQRLATALTSYASEAEPMPDPFDRAGAIALAHPRRRASWLKLRGVLFARWAWIGAALLLAAAAAYLVSGSHPPRLPVVLAVDPAHPIPPQLFGLWSLGQDAETFPNGRAWLDFNGPALIHQPDGSAAVSLGRATAYVDTEPERGELTIAAAGECGEGRYEVDFRDPSTPPGLPTAAPLPPGSSSPPTRSPALANVIRLNAISDACGTRADILRNGPWQRAREALRQGTTVNSLQFTEPFHIDIAITPPFGDAIGTLYQPNAVTRLNVSHAWWNAFFLDDEPVFRDLCDPIAGTLPDIPATADEAAAWLRSTASLGFGVPTTVEIDGRTALRVADSRECANLNIPAVADGVYGNIFYAIPTGDDVILWVVRPDTQAEADIADRLARSIVFD